MVVFCILLGIFLIYLLLLRGRSGHPGMKDLRGWSYAHRGLHGNGVPENSMAAFRAALEGGFGIELDIHLLKDGNLAVIHDSSLLRTTGAEGHIEDLTTEQLGDYCLEGTNEHIPTFRQLLDLYDGKAPLIVELKSHDGNHDQLSEAAANMLDDYHGPYCIESFDPRCVRWFYRNRPQVIRGQLADNFLKDDDKLPLLLRFALTHNLLLFGVCPDFIAYDFGERKTLSNFLCRKVWKIAGVSWTLRRKEDYDTAVAEGWLPIFEGFLP